MGETGRPEALPRRRRRVRARGPALHCWRWLKGDGPLARAGQAEGLPYGQGRSGGPGDPPHGYEAMESGVGVAVAAWTLFLLPGGRPRRFGRLTSAIQAGGRPRCLPRPLASRSRLRMASSICSRSALSSARILLTSIFFFSQRPVLLTATGRLPARKCVFCFQSTPKFLRECNRFLTKNAGNLG